MIYVRNSVENVSTVSASEDSTNWIHVHTAHFIYIYVYLQICSTRIRAANWTNTNPLYDRSFSEHKTVTDALSVTVTLFTQIKPCWEALS